MKYLVTGGAGFIGSHLVDALVTRGDDVTVVDDLSAGMATNVNPFAAFAKLRCEDINRHDYARFDAIFHLASTVGVENVYRDPGAAVWNIVSSAHAVCDALSSLSATTKLVLASSSEVYGSTSMSIRQRETDRCVISSDSRWGYAAAKLATESMVPPNAIIARIFNTIGPRQQTGVVPNFMRAASSGRLLEIYTPLAKRSFSCVHDTVSGLMTLMDKASPGIYNVGAENYIPIVELARQIVDMYSRVSPVQSNPVPYPNFQDIADRRPDLTKLKALGWNQEWSLNRTLELIHQDYPEKVLTGSVT